MDRVDRLLDDEDCSGKIENSFIYSRTTLVSLRSLAHFAPF